MSNTYKGLVVTFDKDIHEDDIQKIVNAIEQIKHVISVKPEVSTFNDLMVRERVKTEIWLNISEVFLRYLK